MQVLERIVGIILPVFIIIALGYAYGRFRGDSVKSDMRSVNLVSMDVLCPLLIFTALASKDFDIAHNSVLILAGALISLGSGLLAWPVVRLFGYDPRSFIPPMMYNNCGNMGLPLAVLAFGEADLSSAVALFIACNLVYFSVGVKIIEAGREQRTPFWTFLRSPMMVAIAIGLLFAAFRITLPEPLLDALKLLGSACIPIMLFSLGVRMMDVSLRSWHIGLMGAIVCPLAGLVPAWVLDQLLPMTAMQRGQMYLFAALPPAIFCFMLAEQYRQEPEKVASIVLLGNVAALVFVPVGLWMGLPAA
jgi:predicted permease